MDILQLYEQIQHSFFWLIWNCMSTTLGYLSGIISTLIKSNENDIKVIQSLKSSINEMNLKGTSFNQWFRVLSNKKQ